MLDIRQLDDTVSVAPQISVEDVAQIAAKGYRILINNRPDGEEMGQPSEADIRAAAQAASLVYLYQPVLSGQLTEADVTAFAQNLKDQPGPILAFCRSGTRCATLWALACAPNIPVADIVTSAASAGYDLSGLTQVLAHRAKAQEVQD